MKLNSKNKPGSDPLKPKFPRISLDNTKPILYAFTDGGISGNGREINEGGYGFVVIENDQVFYEYSRQVDNTTNNIMEMSAIYDCLNWVDSEGITDQVLIHTDSQYCLHSITTWYKGYIARGWKDVKNAELWQQILELKDKLPNVQYKWIRSHQDDPTKVKAGNSEFETRWNTYADKLATDAYRRPVVTQQDMQQLQQRGEQQLSGLPDVTESDEVPWKQDGVEITGYYEDEVRYIVPVQEERPLKTRLIPEGEVILELEKACEQINEANQLLIEVRELKQLWALPIYNKIGNYLQKRGLL